MVEEEAIVVDREGDYVWVKTHRQSSCGQCSVKNGCGTSVLSKVIGNKIAHVRCLNSLDVRIGDRVLIGIEESALLTGSFLVYLTPLISMIVAGALSEFFLRNGFFKSWSFINSWSGNGDFITIFISGLGLFLGLLLSKHFTKTGSQRTRYEPVILKKLDNDEWSDNSDFKPLTWKNSDI